MNVLVYSGSDISPSSLQSTLTALRTLLTPNYAVQSVTAQVLSAHPWSTSCTLLVLPPFLSAASSSTGSLGVTAAKGIQSYIAGGGRLLSLGSDVRVLPQRTSSSLLLSAAVAGISIADATPHSEKGFAKLTLEDVDCRFSFALTPTSETMTIASTDPVQLVDCANVAGIPFSGKVNLVDVPEPEVVGIKVLARFALGKVEPEPQNTLVASIQARFGRGTAAFWGFRIDSSSGIGDMKEKERLLVLRKALETLGLRVPLSEGTAQGLARPTPQILSAAPWRPNVVEAILAALSVPELNAPYELKDTNDTFLLHSPTEASSVFAEPPKSSDDPTTWNPKHIIVYGGAALPPRELTPQFTLAGFFNQLAKERKERGCPKDYPEGSWGVGEALLYGEIVTSTQTMLDKNNRLLTTLPSPLLSLASSQLTGRGRGANVWLSPPGCLQFSLLLRVPLTAMLASKVVFVQYLFALAVAEACRSEDVLGPDTGARVRIKWPNDIYAIASDGEKKKVGGILVNTSFSAGKVELIIGCGLNTLNVPPIFSLAQLLPDAPGGERRSPPTMEETLAAIMARFERMWTEFVRERGSFEPFMDLYLDRWLHSDQLVTLTTVAPSRKVRIVGITSDYGLLRTLPERDAWTDTADGMEYIDLQPDGNSFDLMAGLIKTKV